MERKFLKLGVNKFLVCKKLSSFSFISEAIICCLSLESLIDNLLKDVHIIRIPWVSSSSILFLYYLLVGGDPILSHRNPFFLWEFVIGFHRVMSSSCGTSLEVWTHWTLNSYCVSVWMRSRNRSYPCVKSFLLSSTSLSFLFISNFIWVLVKEIIDEREKPSLRIFLTLANDSFL